MSNLKGAFKGNTLSLRERQRVITGIDNNQRSLVIVAWLNSAADIQRPRKASELAREPSEHVAYLGLVGVVERFHVAPEIRFTEAGPRAEL